MCTTCVNSVHCAEIVYLPTTNSEMCSFVLFMSASFGLLVVVIIDTMKLRTQCIQEPPSLVLDELFQTFIKSLTPCKLLVDKIIGEDEGEGGAGLAW